MTNFKKHNGEVYINKLDISLNFTFVGTQDLKIYALIRKSITGEQIDDLIDYLKTLKDD